ncbi:hypothetical protein KC19_10G162900 [Ceratodon purpureus]|uniref:Uncharacterized protein n=1 Tax=Ceratodon purpureus TaxID=3225 RepID=A0A8T0GMM7_CERPU|nr:hypothetical protein KC19_10G162900 [Ceratodon purpureus]
MEMEATHGWWVANMVVPLPCGLEIFTLIWAGVRSTAGGEGAVSHPILQFLGGLVAVLCVCAAGVTFLALYLLLMAVIYFSLVIVRGDFGGMRPESIHEYIFNPLLYAVVTFYITIASVLWNACYFLCAPYHILNYLASRPVGAGPQVFLVVNEGSPRYQLAVQTPLAPPRDDQADLVAAAPLESEVVAVPDRERDLRQGEDVAAGQGQGIAPGLGQGVERGRGHLPLEAPAAPPQRHQTDQTTAAPLNRDPTSQAAASSSQEGSSVGSDPAPQAAAAPPQHYPPPQAAAAPPQHDPPPQAAAAPPQRDPPPKAAAAPPQHDPPPQAAAAPPQRDEASEEPRRRPRCRDFLRCESLADTLSTALAARAAFRKVMGESGSKRRRTASLVTGIDIDGLKW